MDFPRDSEVYGRWDTSEEPIIMPLTVERYSAARNLRRYINNHEDLDMLAKAGDEVVKVVDPAKGDEALGAKTKGKGSKGRLLKLMAGRFTYEQAESGTVEGIPGKVNLKGPLSCMELTPRKTVAAVGVPSGGSFPGGSFELLVLAVSKKTKCSLGTSKDERSTTIGLAMGSGNVYHFKTSFIQSARKRSTEDLAKLQSLDLKSADLVRACRGDKGLATYLTNHFSKWCPLLRGSSARFRREVQLVQEDEDDDGEISSEGSLVDLTAGGMRPKKNLRSSEGRGTKNVTHITSEADLAEMERLRKTVVDMGGELAEMERLRKTVADKEDELVELRCKKDGATDELNSKMLVITEAKDELRDIKDKLLERKVEEEQLKKKERKSRQMVKELEGKLRDGARQEEATKADRRKSQKKVKNLKRKLVVGKKKAQQKATQLQLDAAWEAKNLRMDFAAEARQLRKERDAARKEADVQIKKQLKAAQKLAKKNQAAALSAHTTALANVK